MKLTANQLADLSALYIRCYERLHVCPMKSVCGECLEAYLISSEVNGCAGLNPAAYRECVEALRTLHSKLVAFCMEPLKGGKNLPDFQDMEKAKQALAHAQEVA